MPSGGPVPTWLIASFAVPGPSGEPLTCLPASGACDLARSSGLVTFPAQIGKEDCFPLRDVARRLTDDRAADGERGQGLAEYALILALIAIVAILSLVFLGDTINDLMSYIGSTVSQNT